MSDLRKNREANRDRKVPCFVCEIDEPLPTAEDHHRVPRAFGGSDDPSNRVWLCPSCHARLHRIQGYIVKGQKAAAFDLCQQIFPQNGKARGQLWTLANEAAEAQNETKEVFSQHQTHKKVALEVEVEVWEEIKVAAKARKMSASKYAAAILKKAANDRL